MIYRADELLLFLPARGSSGLWLGSRGALQQSGGVGWYRGGLLARPPEYVPASYFFTDKAANKLIYTQLL